MTAESVSCVRCGSVYVLGNGDARFESQRAADWLVSHVCWQRLAQARA